LLRCGPAAFQNALEAHRFDPILARANELLEPDRIQVIGILNKQIPRAVALVARWFAKLAGWKRCPTLKNVRTLAMDGCISLFIET
jgi:hypothetical protein